MRPNTLGIAVAFSCVLIGSRIDAMPPAAQSTSLQPWTFISLPDFLNFDIEYPQAGWEDALGFIMNSMKKEQPAFVMVAGDLVMGHWGTEKEEIDSWANRYYPAWLQRFKDHGLQVYTAIGDHEIGDNPWRGAKAKAIPFYKNAFRRHLNMPLNGPKHLLGTAFYWIHHKVLFVSVDVFETGISNQGQVAAGVTGQQLQWLDQLLNTHRSQVDHIVVMGHTPVLRPVRKFSSSGMLTVEGRESPFWQTMARHNVDLFLCGEVHAVTCTQKDGIQQVAHGGLIGRTTKPNYMVVTVHPNRLELTLKEIDLVNGTGRLWQQDKRNGPWGTITISNDRKQTGFTPIGQITIKKLNGKKSFEGAGGFFDGAENLE
ncbi:MAG: metallophosphoesterase family protein [Pirellulaceae bacterium]|nr:metallophosphoesterase family protein [Pirellulaceae bacterium]